MGRKQCTWCHGNKRVHTDECKTRRYLDAQCDCGYPTCHACKGTGERNRHEQEHE
jgi:hypothetical protein